MASTATRVYAGIIAAQALDSTAAAILISVVPYLAMADGASAVAVASLIAVQMFSGAVGAPVLGRLSERVSQRAALLSALCALSACCWLQATLPSLTLLFVLRSVSGFMSSNLVILESIVARLTTSDDRVAGMARLRLGSTVGLVVGPGIAALLGKLNLITGVRPLLWFVAVVQTLVPVVIALAFAGERALGAHAGSRAPYTRVLLQFLSTPRIRDFTAIKALIASCFALLTSLAPVWAHSRFAWTATELLGLLWLFGLSLFVVQATIATKRGRFLVSDGGLVVACSIAIPAFGLLVLVPSRLALASCYVSMGLACAVVNIVVPAAITGLAMIELGSMLGIMSASALVSSTIAPLAVGAVYELLGASYAWCGGLSCAALAAALAIKQLGESVTPLHSDDVAGTGALKS
jgi:predicted MFS family arabinose efflux permease